MSYQPLPPEPTRQEQIEWPAAFLLNRPLNPKLKMEVPNSLGFYKSSHPLLDRPRNPRLSSTIRKSHLGWSKGTKTKLYFVIIGLLDLAGVIVSLLRCLQVSSAFNITAMLAFSFSAIILAEAGEKILSQKTEKAQPKQEHVSLFEVLEDSPYAACEICETWQEVVPEVEVEVFYEREKEHTHFLLALGKYSPIDRKYITKCIDAWADYKPTKNIRKGVL